MFKNRRVLLYSALLCIIALITPCFSYTIYSYGAIEIVIITQDWGWARQVIFGSIGGSGSLWIFIWDAFQYEGFDYYFFCRLLWPAFLISASIISIVNYRKMYKQMPRRLALALPVLLTGIALALEVSFVYMIHNYSLPLVVSFYIFLDVFFVFLASLFGLLAFRVAFPVILSLQLNCPNCGATCNPNDKFCRKCGHKLLRASS